MALDSARAGVERALAAYRACVEQEAQEYGPEYERVTFMEYEAPAPDPCAQAFQELLQAVRAYEGAGGRREDLDLGVYEERVYRALDKG